MKSPYVNYRMNYPESYKTNIFLTKFEKDAVGSYLHYTFVDAFPINVSSIPVSYEGSNLLQCSVSMSYIRYVRENETQSASGSQQSLRDFQPQFGAGVADLLGTLSNFA